MFLYYRIIYGSVVFSIGNELFIKSLFSLPHFLPLNTAHVRVHHLSFHQLSILKHSIKAIFPCSGHRSSKNLLYCKNTNQVFLLL